ncbi:MAG TPA: hypothetical protein P5127_04105 [Oscillospiraceae bacterium]|nr:hypothetical protein [Oscillospiraceae bacterium]
MRRKNVILVLISLITVVTLIAVAAFTFFGKQKTEEKEVLRLSESGLNVKAELPQIIADGGSPSNKASYTYSAFLSACQEGYSAVTFKIFETADGLWVVSKSDNLAGYTAGKGKVSKLDYRDILKLNLLDKRGKVLDFSEPGGPKVPEFEELAKITSGYNVHAYVWVEVASPSGLKKITDLISSEEMFYNFSIISQDIKILENVKSLSPKTGRVYFVDDSDENLVEYLKTDEELKICLDKRIADENPDFLKEILQGESRVILRGVSDYESLKAYFALGIKLFISDNIAPN